MELKVLEKEGPHVRVPDEIIELVLSSPYSTLWSLIVYPLNAVTYYYLHLYYNIISAEVKTEIVEDCLQEAQAGPVCIIKAVSLLSRLVERHRIVLWQTESELRSSHGPPARLGNACL